MSNNTSWRFLNEIRNYSLHRERIPGHVRIDMIENVNNNSSQSEQTIHFVENVRTRNNTYRQKDIILFFDESLELMTKLSRVSEENLYRINIVIRQGHRLISP
jgi:hypothetical protein